MNRPPTMRASGWLVWMTTVSSSGVSIEVTLSVEPEKIRPSPPSTSSEYFTSLDVIGSPSDHLAPSIRWNVTVFLSSETSQLSAMPGAGDRSSGLKLTSWSQLSAQTRKFSSSWATNGLSVWTSCPQPILRTFFFAPSSWAPAGNAATVTASATAVTSIPTIVLSLIQISSWSFGYRRLCHFQGLRAGVEPDGGAQGHVRHRGYPERRDQLVEDLLDRERRLRALRHRLTLQVHVRAEHESGHVVELARPDQVVEAGVDQVLVGVEVLDHQDAAVGLHLEGSPDAGAEQRQAAATGRASGPPAADG